AAQHRRRLEILTGLVRPDYGRERAGDQTYAKLRSHDGMTSFPPRRTRGEELAGQGRRQRLVSRGDEAFCARAAGPAIGAVRQAADTHRERSVAPRRGPRQRRCSSPRAPAWYASSAFSLRSLINVMMP